MGVVSSLSGGDATLSARADAGRVVRRQRTLIRAARRVLEGRCVIIGDMMVQAVATPVSESLGIPSMLLRVGLLQVAVVLLLASWGVGLREAGDQPRDATTAPTQAAA